MASLRGQIAQWIQSASDKVRGTPGQAGTWGAGVDEVVGPAHDEAGPLRQKAVLNHTPAYTEGVKTAKLFKMGGALAAPAAAVGELMDKDSVDMIDPSSDMTGEDRLRQGARVALRTGGGILGGAGGAALGGGPVSGFMGAIPGSIAGYKAGDSVADFLVGPQRSKALRMTGGAQTPDEGSVPAAQGPAASMPNLRTGSVAVDPNVWMQDKQGPDGSTKPAFIPVGAPDKPAEGLTANETQIDGRPWGQYEVPRGGILISNDQTGKVTGYQEQNPDVAIANERERMRAVSGMDSATVPAGRGMRGGGPAQPGSVFGDMAKVGGYAAAGREAKNKADLSLRSDANRIALAKANLEYGFKDRELNIREGELKDKREEAGRKQMDSQIEGAAREIEPARSTGNVVGYGAEKESDYTERVKKRTDALRNDIQFSVGNRGKRYGDLSEPERQQLFLAAKIKRNVESGRDDIAQMGRDFFGIKRFDSRDLYSYMPKTGKNGELLGAETTIIPFQGGYTLRSQNGSTMTAKRGVGGEWNLTGPNGAIDADTAALFQPHIDALEKRLKVKGK